MWHEARRQEKKIRGLMVDFKRRADRRREFYEKIKQDPTQFLRMYGRPVKIHLDPAVAMAAEGPQSMMPWQGDALNMIDRFDVRANLDSIPEFVGNKPMENSSIDEEEERLSNYERYRTLVENEASGLSEEQCLHQIYLDEHFGTISKGNEEEKKKNADKKAAIGFIYEDSTPVEKTDIDGESEEESDDDLETADLDVTIDVDALTLDQAKEVNLCATQYGMKDDDFVRLLRQDKDELEALKEARQLEEAKAQFSGRKSRRERRAINEKKHNPHRFNRPSYAARESPKYEPYKRPGSSSRSRSRSRSRSSEVAKVKFITSFGNESDEETVVQGPSLPSSVLQTKQPKNSESSKCETPWLSKHNSTEPKKDVRKSKRSSSRSRSRSRSRRRRRSSSRSLSSRSRSSRSRSRSGSRQRRYSPNYRRGPSRGRSRRSRRSSSRRRSSSSRSRSRSKSKSRSRSRSPENSTQKRSRSKTPEPTPIIKRYRRESLSSNSGISDLDSDDGEKSNQSSIASRDKTTLATDITKLAMLSGGNITSKNFTQKKETPRERLKRRMQAQLNKQFKADKKAEISKISKQEQDRLDREEEIRNLALEMRRREREKRHREREEEELNRRSLRENRKGSKSSSSSRSSSSPSSSRNSSEERLNRSHGSRSLKSPDRDSDDRDRIRSDRRTAERSREERGSDRRPEGRTSGDGEDRRRRSGDNDWDSGRDSRRRDDSNQGSSRDWRRDSQSYHDDHRDRDRRDRHWDRDGRRSWRDRDDRDWRNRGPPASSHYRDRPPLLHRPDSPLRSHRHPRN